MTGYYDREQNTLLDGTPLFKSAEDEASEQLIARQIEAAWGVECRVFGHLSPIDWYFLHSHRMVGVGELKTRSHPVGAYPTVFLNVRKWLAMSLASTGLGVPALFIVRFEGCVRWINVQSIAARVHRMGGCRHRVKSVNDIEPVIEVPIDQMLELSCSH